MNEKKNKLIVMIICCCLAVRSDIRLFVDLTHHREIYGGQLFASIIYNACAVICIYQYLKSKKNND